MENLNKNVGLYDVRDGRETANGVAGFNLQKLNDLTSKSAYQCNAVKASFHVILNSLHMVRLRSLAATRRPDPQDRLKTREQNVK